MAPAEVDEACEDRAVGEAVRNSARDGVHVSVGVAAEIVNVALIVAAA